MMTGRLKSDYEDQLAAERETVEQYLSILNQESDLLAETLVPFQQLSDLTEAKRHCAEVLAKMVTERRDLAEQLRAPDEVDYAQVAAEMGCAEAWQTLVTLYAEAESSNKRNGVAIQDRLDHTERAIDFLRQQTANDLYSASGQYEQQATGGRINQGA